MTDADETRERHVPEGTKITAKLKRGTGTRDQDTLKIEGRGEDATEAWEDFHAALTHVEENDVVDRLRDLQASDGDGGGDDA